MFRNRRRTVTVLAGLALAVLVGAAGQAPAADRGSEHSTAGGGSVLLAEAAPVDAAVAVVRPRMSPSGVDVLDARWTRLGAVGLALSAAAAAGLGAAALASWWLSRRGRLGGVRRGLRSSVATRAPPALAFA
jgi:hypothetical protein